MIGELLRPSWRGRCPGWWRRSVLDLTRRCGPAYQRTALSTYSVDSVLRGLETRARRQSERPVYHLIT